MICNEIWEREEYNVRGGFEMTGKAEPWHTKEEHGMEQKWLNINIPQQDKEQIWLNINIPQHGKEQIWRLLDYQRFHSLCR